MASEITCVSAAVSSRDTAPIQPSIVGVIGHQQWLRQCRATPASKPPLWLTQWCDDAAQLDAMRRAGQLRLRFGSLKSGERRRQSSSTNLATWSRMNVSVKKPDCIGLKKIPPVFCGG